MPNDFPFTTPLGLARKPCLLSPDRRLDDRGLYTIGLILTDDQLAAVEATLRQFHAQAYPKAAGRPVDLPDIVEKDGQRYLRLESSRRPKLVSYGGNPVPDVYHGDRVSLVCRARPFSTRKGAWITLALQRVELFGVPAPVQAGATDAPGSTARFRRNVRQRGFEAGLVRDGIDCTAWIPQERPVPPITMPIITDHGITDETLAMPRNDAAQLKAEGFLEVVSNQRIREGNEERHARRLGITLAELRALRRDAGRAA